MPFSLDDLGSLFAPLGLISSLIIAGGLFWIVFRTRSTHIFLFRIWRLASGGVEVKDPQIQEYLEKQNSLMSFRFVSGLLSKRIDDAHDLIAFGKEVGDETLEEFRNAGRYFNPSTKQVDLTKIPKPPWQAGNWILGKPWPPYVLFGLECVDLPSTGLRPAEVDRNLFHVVFEQR